MQRARSNAHQSMLIVIKLGTSSIIHETTHQPLLSILSSVVETVVRLRADGHRVVLVSSGAIGVGMKRMDISSRPKSLAGTQALAAIGQGRLIALWDNLFSQLGQPMAQVLLTRGDISDRTRYLNAVNTLTELLTMGVVPIVNENDTISVSEIKFGDNDTLSAITSSMLHADYLFLLTDVEALYTSNPRKDPLAKPVDVVTSISAIRAQVSTATLGSKLGTGGMETKLIAAEIATGAGVATVITSSRNPANIFSIIEYVVSESETSADPKPRANPLTRPPHTLFTPSATPLRDLKSWTSHTLTPSGSVIIDMGAHHVLSRRESGGRLLPAGVLAVRGTFASGQAVRVIVRRRRETPILAPTAMAPTASGSTPPTTTAEFVSRPVLTYTNAYTPASISPMTQPSTPTLIATDSLSSSVSTLDPPLSRQNSFVSISDAAAKAGRGMTAIPEEENGGSESTADWKKDKDYMALEAEGWEHIEVGRGLANYNSAEISKIRGCRSSMVPQLIGYADSEYVVENITIRVPP